MYASESGGFSFSLRVSSINRHRKPRTGPIAMPFAIAATKNGSTGAYGFSASALLTVQRVFVVDAVVGGVGDARLIMIRG